MTEEEKKESVQQPINKEGLSKAQLKKLKAKMKAEKGGNEEEEED